MAEELKRKTVGLALGSGGFRGPAHVGVIKALIANGIPIDYIAGASIGAWVGAHYALYQDVEKLENDFLKKQREKIAMFSDISRKGGLIRGEVIEKFLRKLFNGAEFKNTEIPIKIVATDLISGDQVIFQKGDLAQAVRASISIPMTFKPFVFKDKLLVDGGLSNPVPDSIVKDMGADIVIGVNLYNKYKYENKASMVNVVMRGVEIILYNLTKSNTHRCDILIEPDTSEFYKTSKLKKYFDDSYVEQILHQGELATEALIPKIKDLLK
ncbi:MAG: patatin-like phospholipase family protein [Candidatus Falkowbacteria bacterium]